MMSAPSTTLSPPLSTPISTSSLATHTGEDPSKPIYVAIKGTVFDVSAKREMYGPGGSYSIFAGRDGSKGLGMSSLKAEDAVADYSGLDEKQMKTLVQWEDFFTKVRNPPLSLFLLLSTTDKHSCLCSLLCSGTTSLARSSTEDSLVSGLPSGSISQFDCPSSTPFHRHPKPKKRQISVPVPSPPYSRLPSSTKLLSDPSFVVHPISATSRCPMAFLSNSQRATSTESESRPF